MKKRDFLKVGLKDYKTVGAVFLSSKYAVKKIIKQVKPDYKYIIEYGAGNGVITKELLKILPPDGKILAIELNKDLFYELSKIKDSRLKILNDDVIKVSKNLVSLDWPRIDAVISGIPLSFLKAQERIKLFQDTYEYLTLGGRFIVYQVSFFALPALKKVFKKVKKIIELRNIPPYFIMVGEK